MTHFKKNESTVQLEGLPVEQIARQAGDLLEQGYH
jgi:hypothetical protein